MDPCINCTAKLAPYVDCPCPVKREWEKKKSQDIMPGVGNQDNL
jgi:hypothetical protein